MTGMFNQAYAFNQPLNHWNVSSVLSMRAMFSSTLKFNQDLDEWKVDNKVDKYAMFAMALKYRQELKQWNLSEEEKLMMFLKSPHDKPSAVEKVICCIFKGIFLYHIKGILLIEKLF